MDSWQAQEHTKKMSLFRQALRMHESLNGVFVQRIMANDVKRLLTNPSDDDPVADALANLDTLFSHCTNELGPPGGGAVTSSVESIVAEAAADKALGINGEGCILLAWKLSRVPQQTELVGIATLHRMKSTDSFSTLPSSFRSAAHYQTLVPYFQGHNAQTVNDGLVFPAGLGIKAKYMYLDVLCSKQRGIGRLLALHAYRYALLKKTKGLVALSFSKRPLTGGRQPASYKLFQDLGFSTIVRNTNYDVAGMYGHWVAKSAHAITFAGLLDQVARICSREGYTDPDTRVWRCPL